MSELERKLYTNWRSSQDYVRIQAIEGYAKIVMKLITCGWKLDGEIMLGQMGVVFEELNDDLMCGVLSEVTKADKASRPTPVRDVTLS